MMNRCYNKNSKDFYLYCKRGINVDKKWHSVTSFVEDMYPTYKKGLSLDRINNKKGYSKSNCCWVTLKEQARNTRKNVFYKGEILTDAAKRLGFTTSAGLSQRLRRGWSIKETFTVKKLSI